MNWIILFLAGLFEVSLTFCLGKTREASGIGFYLWGSGFLASTVLSMALLAKAVQTLPLRIDLRYTEIRSKRFYGLLLNKNRYQIITRYLL